MYSLVAEKFHHAKRGEIMYAVYIKIQQTLLTDVADEPDMSTLIRDSQHRIYELLTIQIPHLYSTMTNRLMWNHHLLLL